MNYKLAKQLKEAGYPQEPKNRGYYKKEYVYRDCDRGGVFWDKEGVIDSKEVIKVPYLEELIDACEDRFGSLEKVKIGWRAKNWDTLYKLKPDKRPVLTIEETPLEAVAKLWLELNKALTL